MKHHDLRFLAILALASACMTATACTDASSGEEDEDGEKDAGPGNVPPSKEIPITVPPAFKVGTAAAPACVDAPADAIHVAPTGDDEAEGTSAAPLKTITVALETAEPGQTIVVHDGTYNELLVFPTSGTQDKPITLRARCGERPVIDGSGLGADEDTPGLVLIEDKSWITVDGFKLTGLTGIADNFPSGVWIRGASSHVTIRNVVVTEIKALDGGADKGAHGIAIYGTKTTPIEDVVIEANELSNLVLGPSEALVVNGNVRKFTIKSNEVHHSNNISYDFIGFEGTCAECTATDLSAAVDRAREGLITQNSAHDISSKGNPAYGDSTQDRSAGCYYVDGGSNLTIDRNLAHHCDIGIELASEHGRKATTAITVRNNFIYSNYVAGISTGGFDSGTEAGGGRAENCVIVHNTIFDSSTESWAKTAFLLQNRNINNTYVNNLIVATQGTAAFSIAGELNENNKIHHNLYVGEVKGTEPGTGSLTKDPLLITGDLHLKAGSPAIGAGEKLAAAMAGSEDLDGQPRGNDIGADQAAR